MSADRGAKQAARALVTFNLPRVPGAARDPGPRARGGTEAVKALASHVGTIRPRGHGAPGLAQAGGGALVVHNSFDRKRFVGNIYIP